MPVRRDPFEQVERMVEQMRRSMIDVWEGEAPAGSLFRDVNVTIEQTDEGFVVLADLPGFETDDLDLTYNDGVLTISGSSEERGPARYRSRDVHETVSIPDDVDEAEIAASYQNGVLEVRLPTKGAGEDAYRIDVEESGEALEAGADERRDEHAEETMDEEPDETMDEEPDETMDEDPDEVRNEQFGGTNPSVE